MPYNRKRDAMMKYMRHPGQIETLIKDYKEEIRHVENLLEFEEDLRVRTLHQETLAENKEALKNLERFLDEHPNIFK